MRNGEGVAMAFPSPAIGKGTHERELFYHYMRESVVGVTIPRLREVSNRYLKENTAFSLGSSVPIRNAIFIVESEISNPNIDAG